MWLVRISDVRNAVLILLAGVCLASGADLFPPWPKIWSSYNTRPKDCHQALIDRAGRKILVGVETIGDPHTMSAHQAITLLINERGFWTERISVSAPGIVYFPALAVDQAGKIWIAWSEFDNGVWRVLARAWERGTLGPVAELERGSRIGLEPTLAALPSGEVFAAWTAEVKGRFAIRGATWRGGQWSAAQTISQAGAQTISQAGEQEFRPAAAVDSNGVLWLAWDRAEGSRYRTLARARSGQEWSREIDVFGGAETRAPQIVPDHSGRMWVLASGQLLGLDRNGQRYAADGLTSLWKNGPDFFAIDDRDRFWFFQGRGQRILFDWQAAPKPATTAMAVLDSGGLHTLPDSEAALGYAAPFVDREGNVWAMNSIQFLRYDRPYRQAAGSAVTQAVPAPSGAAAEQTPAWPREQLSVGGREYRIYWGEMHDHLGEQPVDRYIRDWVDRFYLSARYRFGLDAVALTDHDWPGTTRSMYYVEQALSSVLNADGRFVALSGYEWSGDSQVRARFGDRTVLFPAGYHDPPRISDPDADTAEKLSRHVKEIGGLDWPHHIGRAESPVNPRYLIPETEPVMEMTSGHGVFETYDPQHAVPVPFHTQIIPGTSVQDALALGKRVGMVGSSDSHSGFSGYRVGMLAVVAPQLTRESVLDAIRQRHVYAIRGGKPIVLDFRVDGHFMGESFASQKPPRIHIRVKGPAPITRVELVRSNKYIYARDFTDGALEQSLDYQDESAPPAFYYVRVSQGTNNWAWSSPVWVDKP